MEVATNGSPCRSITDASMQEKQGFGRRYDWRQRIAGGADPTPARESPAECQSPAVTEHMYPIRNDRSCKYLFGHSARFSEVIGRQ